MIDHYTTGLRALLNWMKGDIRVTKICGNFHVGGCGHYYWGVLISSYVEGFWALVRG